MSTINLVPISVNGCPVNLSPIVVHTCPHGSDKEAVENRIEDRLISEIDRRFSCLSISKSFYQPLFRNWNSPGLLAVSTDKYFFGNF
ncbi:MAG: hypothetical protein EOM03_16045 [Clostridia bacterium]|nr:hypothetical protein [Clostridia bacterium]